MKPKILDSQLVSEMRTLRERGFSNREIADQLDISYQTVYRGIGKQGFRSPNRPPEPPKAAPTATERGLPVVRRRITLKGLFCTYELDTDTGSVTVKSLSPDMVLEGLFPIEALELLGEEFIEASKQ